MKLVTDATQVLSAIQTVKSAGAGFSTNFFAAPQKIKEWIEHAELFSDLRDEATLLFRKDRDFWHLYFAAVNNSTLLWELQNAPALDSVPLVVDLIGHEAALGELVKLFEDVGYRRYTRLFRMAFLPFAGSVRNATPLDERVTWASSADCVSILDLLSLSFDRYAEQLPALHEIETAVANRQIFVAKHGAQLAGLLFFETQGFTSLLRYWLVAPEFRDQHFGSILMHRYLTDQVNVRRFILWVIADNAAAIRKYRHYGFVPDDLVDHVLVNARISA